MNTQANPGGGETVLWEGSPSQILNFGVFLLCLLFCWLVVPIFIALWKWLEVRSRRYQLTSERLRLRRGVFSKRTDDLELYRVRDTALEEPFFYRLVGVGRITLETSDRTHPTFVIPAVRQAGQVRELIRTQVEKMRQQKRVRELDVE